MSETTTVYVKLVDEGGSARPTQAIPMDNSCFRILPTPDYDKADEVWEFPPNTVVRCEKKQGIHGEYLLAVQAAQV